ncbi:hypothetical protein D9758_013469 [Tetrapyrgos nigripes]|uniref:Uncharacterized protein n=1 Tax=Tetrapyrgos nigripes TaxID=182062 RepID=A0A8H5CT61_9AGAR|nr:hypothetical protein D9758_013469 [Tetrapyrgos nigripes]
MGLAFGDSFTDNGGGAWVISNHTWPAHPGYDQGRFSNGPVWVEYVAGNLSVPLYDYAVGGATTSAEVVQGFTGPDSSIPVPSIDEQVAQFLSAPPPALPSNSSNSSTTPSRPLFFLLGGVNDLLFNPNSTASRSVQELLRSKDQLQAAYPEGEFVLMDYPNLARIPYSFYLTGASASMSKRDLATFSRELKGSYEDLMLDGIRGSGKNVRFVDLIPLFEDFDYYGEPKQYGIDPLGAYSSCLVGVYQETNNITVCENANGMVFWDEYQ